MRGVVIRVLAQMTPALLRAGAWLLPRAQHLGQIVAVLQLPLVFALLIVYLPLTGVRAPGSSMLGSMFVDFEGWDGFWFGTALFATTWTAMLTICLTLDGERDRPHPWVRDPGKDARWATIPIRSWRVLAAFTTLALPGAIVTTVQAIDHTLTVLGLLLGGVLAYLVFDLSVALLGAVAELAPQPPSVEASRERITSRGRTLLLLADKVGSAIDRWGEQPNVRAEDVFVLPWRPVFSRASIATNLAKLDAMRPVRRIYALANRVVGALIRMSARAGDESGLHDRRLDQRHVHIVAAWNLFAVSVLYVVVYNWLKNETNWARGIPPIVYVYTLLLPVMWTAGALWYHLGRYRLVFPAIVVTQIAFHAAGSLSLVESRWGGPNNTYDLRLAPQAAQLASADVVAAKAMSPPDRYGRKPTLIVVATSGGGILASGWTTTVLRGLYAAYPIFGKELRLISAVSGGSVGIAYYLSMVGDHAGSATPEELAEVYKQSVASSLTASAYGLAFPDFRRTVLPFWTLGLTDRGRLLEGYWRRASQPGLQSGEPAIHVLSSWREQIRNGQRPAVIFNATVMETGERVALTPLSTLRSDWYGPKPQLAFRRHHARTLPEFLDGVSRAELWEPRQIPAWDLDIWTAARISATFPYVSPAPRAAPVAPATAPRNARFHLVDGGYHDNSGVASALDFLSLVLKGRRVADLPFGRVALIEIRARATNDDATPAGAFEASWLGPAVGLLQSWSTAQTATCDTAVNRMIAAFQEDIGDQSMFESFVFAPSEDGPTSWHLSAAQKGLFCRSWNDPQNQDELKRFLDFVGGTDAAVADAGHLACATGAP